MDLLGLFKEKKVEQNEMVHPFIQMNYTFKYLYCFGLGVLTCGHMKAMTELSDPFLKLLINIDFTESVRDRIIIDINNNFDYKINDVFRLIDTKERQYTFAADLYMLGSFGLWSQSYCEKVIEIYMNIFKFTKEECNFFEQFILAAKKNNLNQARAVYQEFSKNGYYISYKLLLYMYNDFKLEEYYGDLILENGENLCLDKPTKIKGDIYVKDGSSLTIDGSNMRINGKIVVDGGKIAIKQANIFVEDCNQTSLFHITNTVLVTIENTTIDCNFKCGVIMQNSGHLMVKGSEFIHSKGIPCIEFSGNLITINECGIEECQDGGLSVLDEAVMHVSSSRFHDCEAEHGGAIYFNSLYNGIITECIFKNCRAKYIAGAIYFAIKKYGQEIKECEFIHNNPDNNVIFNHYLDENNTFL